MPVKVTEAFGEKDGVEYVGIAGGNTGIPKDEVEEMVDEDESYYLKVVWHTTFE